LLSKEELYSMMDKDEEDGGDGVWGKGAVLADGRLAVSQVGG
jgi:hypothetical protein